VTASRLFVPADLNSVSIHTRAPVTTYRRQSDHTSTECFNPPRARKSELLMKGRCVTYIRNVMELRHPPPGEPPVLAPTGAEVFQPGLSANCQAIG
jgi:hypothetical protein